MSKTPIPGMKNMLQDVFRDAAEFNARVAAITACSSCFGPCRDCPGYLGEQVRDRYKNSYDMCRLKRARLIVEKEMDSPLAETV